jgi:hypothetical protein
MHYFRSVADRSPLPVLLYNIPKCVPYQIPIEVIAELADHPNIIGIKDSSGSVDRIRDTVAGTRAALRRTVTVTPVFEAVTGRMLEPRSEGGGSFVSAGDLAGGAAVASAVPAGEFLPWLRALHRLARRFTWRGRITTWRLPKQSRSGSMVPISALLGPWASAA